eukprot:2366150-Pleurochrysis_carterae.AAC.1
MRLTPSSVAPCIPAARSSPTTRSCTAARCVTYSRKHGVSGAPSVRSRYCSMSVRCAERMSRSCPRCARSS